MQDKLNLITWTNAALLELLIWKFFREISARNSW